MGRYLSDFITGRSISEGEAAVAVAIVPATGGWPDAVEMAAHPPVYPQDRFEPLSLPMRGFVNDDGFFVPDPDQLSVAYLLAATGLSDWQAFEAAMVPRNGKLELSHPDRGIADRIGMRQETFPGLAIMHAATYDRLCEPLFKEAAGASLYADPVEAADLAARIVMDGQRRWLATRDDFDCMSVSRMGPSNGRTFTFGTGETVDLPDVSMIFSETSRYSINVFAKDAIIRANADAHLSDGRILRDTFVALAEYQRFATGLAQNSRYFAPSMFARSDNHLLSTVFQAKVLDAAVADIATKEKFGTEYGDWGRETAESLEELAVSLRSALETVETKLALHAAHAADRPRPRR